ITSYRGFIIHHCYKDDGSGFSDAVLNDPTDPGSTGLYLDADKIKITESAFNLLTSINSFVINDFDYDISMLSDVLCVYIAGTGAGVCRPEHLFIREGSSPAWLKGSVVKDYEVPVCQSVLDKIDKLIECRAA